MDSVLRALSIYVFVLILIRLSGKRTMGELTAFDFVLLLIIGEATQQALLGDNFSIMNAFLVVATLIGVDMALGLLKGKQEGLARWIDGAPMVLVQNGRPLLDRMRKERVDEDDIMAAARKTRGLGAMSEIEWAVLEADGKISVIPIREGPREMAETGLDR